MDSLTPGYSRNTTWLTKFAHLVGKENALALTQEIRVHEEKELELAILKHEHALMKSRDANDGSMRIWELEVNGIWSLVVINWGEKGNLIENGEQISD